MRFLWTFTLQTHHPIPIIVLNERHVSHNINNNDWQGYLCLSAPSVVWQKIVITMILRTRYGQLSQISLAGVVVAAQSSQMTCNICATDILKYIWNWPWYNFNSSLTVLSKLFPFFRFSVANSCWGRCVEFGSEHFTSEDFAFSCHLFIRPLNSLTLCMQRAGA